MKTKGFTFLEILFALIVITLFAGLLSPFIFRWMEIANQDKADADLTRIVDVMILFQLDTKLLPRSNGTAPDDQSLDIVFLGHALDLPQDNQWGDWKIENIKKEVNFLRRDLFTNHLMQNNPNDNMVFGDENDYRLASNQRGNGWRGPYLDSPILQQDPWGTAYLISFFKTYDHRLMGKVVSAGPNRKLEVQPFVWVDKKEILQNSDDLVKYFQKF